MDFLSDASFSVPDYLVESGWAEHAPFAFWLIDVLRPDTFVELGVQDGYSFFVINQASKALNTKTRCVGVDDWAAQGDEETYAEVKRLAESRYPDAAELLRTSLEEAATGIADGSVDLLHLQASRLSGDARAAFEGWHGKMSGRGVVLLHGTNVRVKYSGAATLWNELRTEFPHFEFVHGHGLGVLGVGREIDSTLSRLFKAGADEVQTARIRKAYERLGGSLRERIVAAQAYCEIKRQADERVAMEFKLLKEEYASQSKEREAAAHAQSALIIERFSYQMEDLRRDLETGSIGEINSLQHQLREAQKMLKFYKDRYEQALASRSWQVTRPLRAITLKLQGRNAPDS